MTLEQIDADLREWDHKLHVASDNMLELSGSISYQRGKRKKEKGEEEEREKRKKKREKKRRRREGGGEKKEKKKEEGTAKGRENEGRRDHARAARGGESTSGGQGRPTPTATAVTRGVVGGRACAGGR